MYQGDIRLEDTIDIKFTTRQISGAPFTLAGSPVISAYIGNSLTQIAAGITLTVDFDGVTGLNNVRVVATAANGYTAPTNVALVITTGTVNSVSVVGEVVGSFSIEARSAVMPTTPARTLDVSATGEAGVDWANVGTPDSTVGLTGTTIGAVTGLAASNLDATVSSRATPAQVATQVDTVINSNTKAELGAVPASNASLGDKLCFIEMKIRNAETQTATEATISNTSGSIIGTATVSDDGSTFVRNKYA